MRTIALLSALLFPVQGPSPAYVPVHILDVTTRSHGLLLSSGYGHGNVKDGDVVRGFDFVFENCHQFQPTVGVQAYRAEVRENHRLLIEMVRTGTDQKDACMLRVTYQPYMYARKDGQLTTKPLAKEVSDAEKQ